MRWIAALMCIVLPLSALADGVNLAGLPAPVRQAIQRDLDGFLDLATEVIAAYGAEGRLGAEGLALMVAAERARARARALLPLIAADLNTDGALDDGEVALAGHLLSARGRGQLLAAYARAESDGAPGLGALELAEYGRAAAEAAVSRGQVRKIRELLRFDRDGDGAVSRAEVKAGLEILAAQAAQRRGKGGGAPLLGL